MNLHKPLIFWALCLFWIGTTISLKAQNNSEILPTITPYLSELVPYNVADVPDSLTPVKLNFKERDVTEITVNPVHYPDMVWQQTQTNDPNRIATATLLWDVQGIGTGISPPDPSGDEDSLVYIQGTNSGGGGTYRIVNKITGATILGSATMASIGGGAQPGLGDPIILYDKVAKRWFITEFHQTLNRLIIYVSTTSNPQGTYYTYVVNCPNFPDYPKYGIWPDQDAVIISTNEGVCGIYAIKRSDMLSGAATTPIRTTIAGLPGFGFQSITPVDIEGDNTPPVGMKPLFMRHRDDESHPPATAGTDKIEIWELTVTWPATISATKIQDLLINEFDSDLCGLTSFSCVPQPGTGVQLDPLREPAMYKVPYRNMGTHQAVILSFATDVTGTNQAGIRWVELRRPAGSLGTWTKYQEGTYSPDALNRWMPSINIDVNGNIMMAYSTSNGAAGNFPTLRYTGRRPCDPLGTMTVVETIIEPGVSSRTSNTRWGDYHHLSIDAFDGVTFYHTGNYMGPTNSLRTRISSFRMNADANDARLVSAFSTATPPICGTTANVGVIVQNKGTASITGGTIKYQVNGGGFTNQNYTPSPGNIATGNSDTVFFNITGLITGANTIRFVNVTTNGQTPDEVACNDTTVLVLNTVTSSMSVSASITTSVLCNNGTTGVITVTATGGVPTLTYYLNGGSPQPTGVFSGLSPGTYTASVTEGTGCNMATTSLTITNPPAITCNGVITTQVSCNGGSNGAITITGGGGTGTLNYSINGVAYQGSNLFTGLAPGSYTCYVRDANNCVQVGNTLVLVNPTVVNINANSQTNVLCNGGSNGAASVTAATGGAGGYTYNWTPGNPTGDGTVSVTGLTAATWTCTVTDANGCTDVQTFTISQPAVLNINAASQTNVLCNGGSTGAASVTAATGGTGGYAYNWTPGNPTGDGTVSVTGLAAGTWTCTVTDINSCTDVQTFTISQPAVLNINSASQTNVLCNGVNTGAASVTSATGGTGGYTYNWTPGNPTGDGTVSVTGLAAGTWTCTVTDGNLCTDIQTFTITQPATAVSSSISSTTPATCGSSNGSATATASGGTGALSYSWAPSGGSAATASGLAAGSYTVTVTDANGCTSTSMATIGSTGGFTASIGSQTNVSCFGGNNGAASINVSGGVPVFTYAWLPNVSSSSSASGLTAGGYTVTVTDGSGCQSTVTINITQPTIISANAFQLNGSCSPGSTGSAQVAASGGTGSLSYSWAPSGGTGTIATGLSAGIYTVTVTDANLCNQTATTTIVSFPSPTATITSFSNISCNNANDGNATVAGSGGGGGYTYSWLPGGATTTTITGLSSNTYTATVTDVNGCTNSTTVNIINPSAVNAGAVLTQPILCANSNNAIITGNGSGGTGSYQFSLNGGPNQASPTFSGLASGSYTVTVTDANGCSQSAIPIFITNPTAIAVVAMVNSQVACSGSSTGQITASAAGGTGSFQYSIDGINFQAGNVFTGLAAGTYTVTASDANGCTATSSAQTLVDPPVLNVSASVSTPIACNGGTGSITASGSGGTGSLMYSTDGINFQTSTIFNGVGAGSYMITVKDDNGCTSITSVTITEPSAIAMSASPTDITCNGDGDGSITITASGGTGTLQYSIDGINFQVSNSFTFVAANVYQVTVMDSNGCTATQTVTINEPAPLSGNVIPTDVTCNGNGDGSILVNISGGTGTLMYSIDGGVNFQASNIFNGLIPGNYPVVVMDANGCTFTTTTPVNEPALLTVIGLATDEQYGNDGTITINESGGISAYQYSLDGINYQPGNLFINLPPGTYTVYVMDDNGCIATNTVVVGSTLGVDPEIGNTGLQLINLYPNPTKGDFNLHITGIKGAKLDVRIYNTLGEAVAVFSCDVVNGEVNQSFHLSHKIAAGNYFFAMYDGNEKPLIVKFIRN